MIGGDGFSSALTTLHEKAIYIQDGVQYHVERLDYDDRKAYVHQVDSEYSPTPSPTPDQDPGDVRLRADRRRRSASITAKCR